MRCSPRLLLFFAANAHYGLFGLTQFRWGYIAALPQFHSRYQAQEPNSGKFAFLTYMDDISATRMRKQVLFESVTVLTYKAIMFAR